MIEAELHFFEGRIEVWIGDSEQDYEGSPYPKKVFEMEGIEAAELVVKEDEKTKHWKLLVTNDDDKGFVVLVDQSDRTQLEEVTCDALNKGFLTKACLVKKGMALREMQRPR